MACWITISLSRKALQHRVGYIVIMGYILVLQTYSVHYSNMKSGLKGALYACTMRVSLQIYTGVNWSVKRNLSNSFIWLCQLDGNCESKFRMKRSFAVCYNLSRNLATSYCELLLEIQLWRTWLVSFYQPEDIVSHQPPLVVLCLTLTPCPQFDIPPCWSESSLSRLYYYEFVCCGIYTAWGGGSFWPTYSPYQKIFRVQPRAL